MSEIIAGLLKFLSNGKMWLGFAISFVLTCVIVKIIPSGVYSLDFLANLEPGQKSLIEFCFVFAISVLVVYAASKVIAWLKSIKIERQNNAYKIQKQHEDLRDFLTQSPDKFYWLIEHLLDNGNPWTYFYTGGGSYEDHYMLNADWFEIEDAPEKKKVKNRDNKVYQEIYTGRYKARLNDQIYAELKAIRGQTKDLGRQHRYKCPYKWEIAEKNNTEKAK